MRFYSAVLSKNIILHIQKLGRLRGAMCTHLHRSFERKHVHWADNVYASVQKASAKTSFCVYRSWGVLEGSCIRFRLGALSESMYTGQTMYTLLRRSPQQKHHFAYTEAGAYARGNVYASAQESSAKASFCVYRSRRVCEGRCIRICAETCSENIILRIQKPARLRGAMCTHLCRKLSAKA